MVLKDAVELPVGKKLLKADYISAIILFRYPPEDELNVCDEDSDTEDTQAVPPTHSNTVDDSEEVAMSKKFLAVNTVSQLQTIAMKENVVLGPGRKTKIYYIDAIFLARQSKLL
jgi:hypothetical protein